MRTDFGLDMEKAERTFNVEKHDALVLVHPVWGRAAEPDYHRSLIDCVDLALRNGKKVFRIEGPDRFEELSRDLGARNIIDVPDYFAMWPNVHKKRILRLRVQREVDFLAGHIGKAPGDIRLGFTGMFSWGCVYDQVQIWCREVVPRLKKWDWSRQYLPKHPIARGDMILEAVSDDYIPDLGD